MSLVQFSRRAAASARLNSRFEAILVEARSDLGDDPFAARLSNGIEQTRQSAVESVHHMAVD